MSTDLDTKMRINNLLESQLFCVLTTNLKDSNFPYSSLIAFFHTLDLKHIYFATSRKTTKFTNLLSDPKACIFFDNRSNELEDVIETVSATVLGKVKELDKEKETKLISQFTDKYPQLEDFVHNIDTAFLQVLVDEYVVVFNFQKVLRLKIEDS